MYLGNARGVPVRLTSPKVEMLLWGSSLVEVVGEVMVSFFVDVSNDQNDALKWTKFLLVVIVWLFGCDAVGALLLCEHVLGVGVKLCR